ncbi:MAG: hypothetical protein RR626_05585 [Anaerovoracaceae bacterium]
MKDAKDQEITLYFGEEEVPMVPFVEDIIKGAVTGMAEALKGYEKGVEITIKIK